jgi:hypothetical protein
MLTITTLADVAPETPITVGLGVTVLMFTVEELVGTPPFQLLPTVQSLLVAPLHELTCAAAGVGAIITRHNADSETVARNSARLERR